MTKTCQATLIISIVLHLCLLLELQKERTIHELQNKMKEMEKQYRAELESVKSKLIVERHEREREHTDHGAMIL